MDFEFAPKKNDGSKTKLSSYAAAAEPPPETCQVTLFSIIQAELRGDFNILNSSQRPMYT
jgi:hypothetical protein